MSARAGSGSSWRVAALAAAGTAVGVTLATRTDVEQQTTQAAALRSGPDGARRRSRSEVRDALRPGRRERCGGCGSSPSAIRDSALVRLELGLALALSGQQRRRDAGVAGGRSVSSRTPRRRCGRRTSATRTRRRVCRRSCPSFTRAPTAGPASPAPRAPPSSRRCGRSRPNGSSPRPRRLAPNDPEALTAAAVGLYDKDRPGACFLHVSARSPGVSRTRRPSASTSGCC